MPNIEVNGKTYSVTLAITDEEKEKGLQGIKELPENEGMLFCFDPPEDTSFWMKGVDIPLDIIFTDEYGEVISVHEGKPNDETPMSEENVGYVLEVNSGSGIKPGDDIDLSEIDMEDIENYEEDENEEETPKMLVLGNGGEVQMELLGGERIFSRPNTLTMIRLSKKAYKSKKDSDYKALGRKVFQFIEKQDTQEPQYVESPKES